MRSMQMNNRQKRTRKLVLVLSLSLMSGCERPPTNPSLLEGQASLFVLANVPPTLVNTLVVEVTAPDIITPLIFNLPISDGLASGTIVIPIGYDRTITILAFDFRGTETHRGSATVDILDSQNPTLSIRLLPLIGEIPIDVSVGSFLVIVEPTDAVLQISETVQLNVIVIDSEGYVIEGGVVWATRDPAVATVDNTGLVTAWGGGDTEIIAAFIAAMGGVADAAVIRVVTEPNQFLFDWGNKGTGPGQFNAPIGVAVDGIGNIYVIDSKNHRIQKFDSGGQFLTGWGNKGKGDGQFNTPQGLAVDATGSVYVADSKNNRVQKFDSSGQFLTEWGSKGKGGGRFNTPTGVAVAEDGTVYVVDSRNNLIQAFDEDANLLFEWGAIGTAEGEFDKPIDVAIGENGNVYVSDQGNNRIQKFDMSGQFLLTWGTPGTSVGQFDKPFGLAVQAGVVFVADHGNNRIQRFDSLGQFLTEWGANGSDPGQFKGPAGIALNSSGSVCVVDKNNHRIQRFGPG